MEETLDKQGGLNKTINGVGIRWGIFLFFINIVSIPVSLVLLSMNPGFQDDGGVFFSLIITLVMVHILGVSLLYLISKKMPVNKIPEQAAGFGKMLLYIMCTIGLMGIFNLLGMVVDWVFKIPQSVMGQNTTSAISSIMVGSSFFWRVLVIGITAPIAEELIFRKFLIDRLNKYGEPICVIFSGLMFGLFHGNFQQFFGTMAMGMLLAFVYLRTGRVRYTIACHMALNLITSVITTTLAQKAMSHGSLDTAEIMAMLQSGTDSQAVADFTLFAIWFMIMLLLYLVGFIIWIVMFCMKKFRLERKEDEITKAQAFGKFFKTPGMWVFILVAIYKFSEVYVLPLIVK